MKPSTVHPLLGLIPHHPALRLMLIGDTPTRLVDDAVTLTQSRDIECLIQCQGADCFQTLLARYDTQSAVSIRSFDPSQKRYNTQAKLYDFVYVEAAIGSAEPFLNKLHRAMKNGADLFVLLSAADVHTIENWRIALEAQYFVAYNAFELDDTTTVLSAKKMHGWGG